MLFIRLTEPGDHEKPDPKVINVEDISRITFAEMMRDGRKCTVIRLRSDPVARIDVSETPDQILDKIATAHRSDSVII